MHVNPFDESPEHLAAFDESLKGFIARHPLAIRLGLTTADFNINTPIHEWLRITQYVDYEREQIAQRRQISADWKLGLKLLLEKYNHFIKDETFNVSYYCMQIGEEICMPCFYIPVKDQYGIDQPPKIAYLIQNMLEGAAAATIIPELENEYKRLAGTSFDYEETAANSNSEATERTKTLPLQETLARSSDSLEKLQWKKKLPLLAYLFHRLQEEGIIQGENMAANLAAIFIDRGYRAIDNRQLNTYLSKLRTTNKTTQGEEQIDELIELLKSLDK